MATQRYITLLGEKT